MPSKYDSLELKTNSSLVSSQTFNLVPHFSSMDKMYSQLRLSNDGNIAKIGDTWSLHSRF